MIDKLVFVGPKDVHTSNFLELVKPYFKEICVICNQKWDDPSLKFYECSFSLHPKVFFKSVKTIKSILQKEQPSLIHVHQANSYGFYTVLGNRKIKRPIILTALGSDVLVLPHQKMFFKWMVKFILNRVDRTTADAKVLSDAIIKLSPKHTNKVLLVNFGISDKMQDVQVKEKVIYSNRLHNDLYQIEKIITAFSKFYSKNKEYNLVVAGTGNNTDQLKEQVKELQIESAVSFVGWQQFEGNLDWYQRSEYWISIPTSDATAISLLEAMACGCIPILSDLPANREWIIDEENGFLVKDLNADFLSEIIGRDLSNLKHENALLIEKNARKSTNSKKFHDLYKEVLGLS